MDNLYNKKTILAGAGVSFDYPACFPLASQIIDLLIHAISVDNNIYNTFKEGLKRDKSNKQIKLSDNQIRFEMLIDVISECDSELHILDAIKEYKTPNLNHYNLAQLAINGHYVFTTNFDDLIERAIYNLGYSPKTICSEIDYKNFSFCDDGTIPVFKLHGSYYKHIGSSYVRKIKKTIQASLISIMKDNSNLSLPNFKINVLKECLSRSSNLLFVGYSGSDDFDVIPSLQSIETKNIIWINHCNNINYSDTSESINQLDNSGMSLLIRTKLNKCPYSVKLFNTNTKFFLMGDGGIYVLPKQKSTSTDNHFESYINKWRDTLSNDDKYRMAGELLYRLCYYDESYKIFDLITPDHRCYVQAQLRCITCLDQISKYKSALEKLENLKQISQIDKHEQYLNILEKEAYLNYRINPNNFISEKLFKYVIRNAKSKYHILQSAINNYALYLRDQNRCQEALSYYNKCKSIAIKTGNIKQKYLTESNIATILFDEGHFIKSEEICLNGYDLSKKMGDYRQLGVFENLLANICFVKGDYTGAIDLCNKSIERDKNINNETDSSVNELLIGQCFFELGDYSEAETHFSIAQSLFDASDDKYYEYELLFYKIIIAILSNKIEAAYNINQRFNTTTTNKTERIYTSIASKIIKNIYETQNNSFEEDLLSLITDTNNQELVSYINITYYLLLLDIPVELIGISHIKKVEKIYAELGNKCRTAFFNILNCQFTL